MNKRNNSNNSNISSGLYFAIIFALFGFIVAVPYLIPILIIVGAILFKSKKPNLKNISKEKDEIVNNINKINKVNKVGKPSKNNDNYDNVEELGDIKNKTDAQRRLEALESLYKNGFMEKDEYEEAKKRFI